jgi:hypothetical protein
LNKAIAIGHRERKCWSHALRRYRRVKTVGRELAGRAHEPFEI